MPSRGEIAHDKPLAFAPETADLRAAEWTVASDPENPVTIVVDSLRKTFGLEELLHAERDSAVAIDLDPEGYLFSYIQSFQDHPECVLPDRADITWSTHCLRSFARHVLDVAVRRGANVEAPFGDEPILFLAGDERVVAEDLLQVPRGRITEKGMRENIRTVLQGVAAILAGGAPEVGASTIELCRAQLWQWVQRETGVLDTGRIITAELFNAWLDEELAATPGADAACEPRHLQEAARILGDMTLAAALAPSLVEEAYRLAD